MVWILIALLCFSPVAAFADSGARVTVEIGGEITEAEEGCVLSASGGGIAAFSVSPVDVVGFNLTATPSFGEFSYADVGEDSLPYADFVLDNALHTFVLRYTVRPDFEKERLQYGILAVETKRSDPNEPNYDALAFSVLLAAGEFSLEAELFEKGLSVTAKQGEAQTSFWISADTTVDYHMGILLSAQTKENVSRSLALRSFTLSKRESQRDNDGKIIPVNDQDKRGKYTLPIIFGGCALLLILGALLLFIKRIRYDGRK